MPLPYSVMVSANFQIYDTPGLGLFLAAPYYAANLAASATRFGQTFTGGTNA